MGKYALKSERFAPDVKARILVLVTMPTFYSEVSTLEGIRMYQGNYFVGKPHYEKME